MGGAALKHTAGERRVLELTKELAVAYKRLENEEGSIHRSHWHDVADAVNVVQRILAIRLAKRVDPEAWR